MTPLHGDAGHWFDECVKLIAERDQLAAENHRLREALKTAALAMWRSESNMDSEAAAAEEVLSGSKEDQS